MKRKYFSVLLMAAMTVASTSVMTSCKDYDDDINALRTEITNNATTLNSLVTEKVNNLTTELTNLKSQQATLEKALETAQSNLETAIKKAETDSKAYADVQAAAAQKAAIEAAKKNLDDAVAVINAAIDAANTRIDDVNSKVTTNTESIAKLIAADNDLQNAINVVKADAEAAAKKALDAAQAAQATADANTAALAQVSENLTKVKSDLEKSISVLGEKVDANTTAIASNKAEVDAKLAEVNSLISTNADAIKALQDADAALLTKITKNTEDLQALGTQLATVQAQCELNLANAKAYTDTQVAALKEALGADIATVKADLAAAITRIATNEAAISELQKKFDEEKAAQKIVNDKVSSDIQKLQDDLTAANEKIQATSDALAAAVIDLTAKMEAADSELAQKITEAKAELQGKIDANSTKISTLQDKADELTTAVGNNTTSINELQTKLEALKNELSNYVTNATLEAYKSQVNDAISTAISNLGTTLRNEFNLSVTNLNTEISNLKAEDAKLDGLIKDLQNKIKDITGDTGYVKSLQTQIDDVNKNLASYAKASTVSELSGKFTTLDSELTSLKENFDKFKTKYGEDIQNINKTISTSVSTLRSEMKSLSDNFQKQIDLLTALSHQLKSLVFGPTEYYQGIEAIGIFSYNYNAVKALPAYDENKDQIAANSPQTEENPTSVVPDVTATYYLNPSNATVDENVSHYNFIVQNAAYTRSAEASDITIKSVEAKDGKALVTFSMKNADKIAKIPTTGDGKVDVAALRYTYKSETGNDTIITSDWAALKQYVVKDFYINKADAYGQTEAKNEKHLAKTATEAIEHNGETYTYPTLEIQYDDTEGIDLDKWINVHFNYNNGGDAVWGGQATVNKKGFKLAYSLVGYIADGNKTNESAHAKITGTTLTVNGYKEETGRQIIGRTPLVRVTLVDENTNNQIASVGYIIVKITDKKIVPVEATADPIVNAYTVKCEGNSLNNVQAITWEEVENKVLSKLGVSKQEFEDNWTFDEESQYLKKDNGDFEVAPENFGTVAKTTVDSLGHQTNVLKWTVTNKQAYTYFVTKKQTSKSIWVKFAPTKTTDKPIYVQLTWTPKAINKAPEATIKNSVDHKKTAAWHAANSMSAGYEQLQIQVGNATEKNATCEFDNLNISQTFNKSVLEIVKEGLGTTYKELANNATVTFTFAPAGEQTHKKYTGVSGKSYDIWVSESGDEIGSGSTTIASILPENGVVDIKKNDVTKDILNKYADVKDLANALTLTVKANVKTCTVAENLITLNNNTFDVKVIKPLFVSTAKVDDMQLNKASTLTQPVSFSFKDFNGYTPETFYEYSNKKVYFFNFYGLKSVKQAGTIQTDYSGAKKDIDEKDIKVTYKAPTALEIAALAQSKSATTKMGTVTLTQENRDRANGFNVWIPVEIEYSWGTLKTEITISVKAAEAASAKKH